MKLKTLITAASFAGVLAMSGSAFGQTATSNVVGYETLNWNAGFNFIGLRLHEAVEASGTFDGNTGTELSDSSGDFSALSAGTIYLLELANGTVIEADGSAFSGGTVSGLSGITAGDQGDYEVRPAATLTSAFGNPAGGANNTDLVANSNPGNADQIWLSDGAGSFNKYYLNAGFGTADWQQVGVGSINPDNVILSYVDCIVLQAVGTGSTVVAGDLKVAPTNVDVGGGFNFVGGVYPVGATLASQFGDPAGGANNTDLVANSNPGNADQIWISDGAGSFNKYYLNAGFGTADWQQVGVGSIDPATISISSGYVLQSVGASNIGQSAPSSYAGL